MTYRILSLDGGGSWALIEARTLAKLYGATTKGHDVLRQFDLVAANSAGSLVLAGLVENLTLDEISDYFLDPDKRGSLFQPTTKPLDSIVSHLVGIGPKYDAASKLLAIEQLLPAKGTALIDGIVKDLIGPGGKPVHLLIVGFDYDRNRAVFFRSAIAAKAGWGTGQSAKITLAEAVHASTNAPVNYFDAPAELPSDPDRFWDGGVTGCNNPSLAAVTEALVLSQVAHDIRVLSLGTATVSLPLVDSPGGDSSFVSERQDSGLVSDLKKLATAILDDPPDAATYIAHAVTGGSDGLTPPIISRVVRMSPLIAPYPAPGGRWQAPAGWSPSQFKGLREIDLAALKASDITAIDSYCSVWLADAAPNQPIRSNGEKFDPAHPEIGYATFSEALTAWKELFPTQVAATPNGAATQPQVIALDIPPGGW